MPHPHERAPRREPAAPDQPPFFEFGVEVEALPDGTRVVAVAGDLDLHTAPEFERHLVGTTRNGATSLVVDLDRCTFIDSTALGILIGANRRLFATGRSIAVVTGEQNVRKVFEVTGLDRVFTLYDERSDALAQAPSG
jgi:anti-sigma B factor antagonist